jgi:hypothetical protein
VASSERLLHERPLHQRNRGARKRKGVAFTRSGDCWETGVDESSPEASNEFLPQISGNNALVGAYLLGRPLHELLAFDHNDHPIRKGHQFAERGRAELHEVTSSGPEAGEVWVATTISAVSNGTERWALMDELRSAYIPTGTTYSCVAGYQRAGLVTELGPGVTDDAVGERVAVWGSPERAVFEGGRCPQGESDKCTLHAYVRFPGCESTSNHQAAHHVGQGPGNRAEQIR